MDTAAPLGLAVPEAAAASDETLPEGAEWEEGAEDGASDVPLGAAEDVD